MRDLDTSKSYHLALGDSPGEHQFGQSILLFVRFSTLEPTVIAITVLVGLQSSESSRV